MRILILANDDEGLYQFRKELIVELLKENEVYASVPEGPYKQDLMNLGCKLELIQFNRHGINPIADIKLFLKYRLLIKKIKPSVVLTYTIKPNVYGGLACTLLKVPFIVNITGLGSAVENGGFMQIVTILLYKIGIKHASTVFFQNQANKEFMLSHGVVKNNYEMIPGSGVNLNHFTPLEYPKSDNVEFSFISRIMKEKGADLYLKAAEIIKKEYPNTIFHVCGMCEENYYDRLKDLQDKGIIIYHGNLRDVREIHKSSFCTVHPTYYPEGLSNVLLESLSCCRPIITTDRSGCKEVVEDGLNGFIVKQKDLNDLVEKIRRFISLSAEKKSELGKNGRLKVEKEFSREIVVEKYKNAINRNSKRYEKL